MQHIAYVTLLSDSPFCKLYFANAIGAFKQSIHLPIGLDDKVQEAGGNIPTWIISNDCLKDVLKYNDIDTYRSANGKRGNVRYLNEKPVLWYQFQDDKEKSHFCFNINEGKQFFLDWLTAGSPTLYRYTTNSKETFYKESFSSSDNAPPFIFDSVVVMGYNFTKIYGMSREDIAKIANYCAGSSTGRLLQYYLQGVCASNEEVKQSVWRIHKAEQEIDSLIESHRDEIRELVTQNEQRKGTRDSGWINWKINNPLSLLKDLCILEAVGKRSFHIFYTDSLYQITYSRSREARVAGARRACEILNEAGYQMEFESHNTWRVE